MVALCLCSEASSADLGVHGQLFPIVEPDILAQITQRLQYLKTTGKLDKINTEFRDRVVRSATRPAAVAGIRKAVQTRTWLVDPSIVLDRDLADHRGVVFARAGTRVNPLEHLPLSKSLLFINGDDEQEVAFVRAKLSTYEEGRLKVILVRGDFAQTSKAIGSAVYFDQGGALSTRWGIQGTPALVEQDGLALRVTEVSL